MQEREEGAFSPSFGRSPLSLSLSYLPPSDASGHAPSYLLPTSAFAPTISSCLPHVSSRAPLAQPYDASCFLPAFLGRMHHLLCSYFSCPVLGPFCRVQPFWQLQYHAYQMVSIFSRMERVTPNPCSKLCEVRQLAFRWLLHPDHRPLAEVAAPDI